MENLDEFWDDGYEMVDEWFSRCMAYVGDKLMRKIERHFGDPFAESVPSFNDDLAAFIEDCTIARDRRYRPALSDPPEIIFGKRKKIVMQWPDPATWRRKKR